MEVGHIRAQVKARDLGVMPVDREGDGGVAQDGEIKGIVGVLPNVVAGEDEVLADSLLQTRMELIAEARLRAWWRRRGYKPGARTILRCRSPGWRGRGFR